MKKHTLHIIVRTSMNLHSTAKRPFGLTKESMVFKCLKSLLESCSLVPKRVCIDVVDDSSPPEIRERLQNLLSKYPAKTKLIEINVKSNKESLKFSFSVLDKAKEDLFLMADDDYLYVKNAIPFILNAFDDKIIGTSKFALFPFDDPERYEKIYPSYIFLSKDCHWRSIGHATGSMVIPRSLFKKYRIIFKDFEDKLSEKITISKIWKEVPLISPIPSLAAHLNENTIPPFVDWRSIL